MAEIHMVMHLIFRCKILKKLGKLRVRKLRARDCSFLFYTHRSVLDLMI